MLSRKDDVESEEKDVLACPDGQLGAAKGISGILYQIMKAIQAVKKLREDKKLL